MPAHHKIYTDLNLIVATFEGRLTVSEIIADNIAYACSPERSSDQVALVDTSGITEFSVGFQGILELGKTLLGLMDPFEPTVMTAIYAPDPSIFAKAQIYQRITSGSDINCVGVFRSPEDAWQFLQIAPDRLPPNLRSLGLLPA